MIGVRLNGRLGNQLFQYALAFSLAKRFSTFYVIDNDYKVDYVKKYFRTNALLNNRISRGLYKKFCLNKIPFVFQNNNEALEEMQPLINNDRFYYGFFQSEQYFKIISNTLQKRLIVKNQFRADFKKRYGHIFESKVLVIHYRLGDYIKWGGEQYGGYDLTLPETYYKNALKKIKNLADYTVLIVTDDAESIAGKLPEITNKIIISDNEIIDFQIVMSADIIIASNSSFCWWAAYLNVKQPAIFAPKYWHGFKVNTEIPSGILPDKFIKVDVC